MKSRYNNLLALLPLLPLSPIQLSCGENPISTPAQENSMDLKQSLEALLSHALPSGVYSNF
ncbi:MAG: hypothetical protein VX084_10705 [Planctomycetota bacterium]|nr:hypothetical protein [Planctomycetota bacterium]